MYKDCFEIYRDRVTVLTNEIQQLIKNKLEDLDSKDMSDIYILAYDQGAIVSQ